MVTTNQKRLAVDKVRRSNRHRVVLNVPVRMGLKNGTLVDVSATGILATHTGTTKTGSIVAIDFAVAGQRFTANGRIESCTVVGLGADADDTGATVYASRVFFVDIPSASRQILDDLLKRPG